MFRDIEAMAAERGYNFSMLLCAGEVTSAGCAACEYHVCGIKYAIEKQDPDPDGDISGFADLRWLFVDFGISTLNFSQKKR